MRRTLDAGDSSSCLLHDQHLQLAVPAKGALPMPTHDWCRPASPETPTALPGCLSPPSPEEQARLAGLYAHVRSSPAVHLAKAERKQLRSYKVSLCMCHCTQAGRNNKRQAGLPQVMCMSAVVIAWAGRQHPCPAFAWRVAARSLHLTKPGQNICNDHGHTGCCLAQGPQAVSPCARLLSTFRA